MASLDDAMTRRSPPGETSIRPAADTSSTSTHRSARRVRSSTTSKSSTSVSANSTNVRAINASLGIATPRQHGLGHLPVRGPVTGAHGTPRGRPSPARTSSRMSSGSGGCSTAAVIETQTPADHIFSHVGQRAAVAKGVGPKANQRLPQPDGKLDGNHARRLVYHILEFGSRLKFRGYCTSRRTGLHDQHGLGRNIGHDQCVSMLFVAERAWPIPIQIEGSDTDRTHVNRKAEDGPHTHLGGGGEAEPAGVDRSGQVEHSRLVVASTQDPHPANTATAQPSTHLSV